MATSEQQSPVKRHKAINKFSSEVDKAISILKDLDFGIYKRDILQVENIVDVVTFIEANIFNFIGIIFTLLFILIKVSKCKS